MKGVYPRSYFKNPNVNKPIEEIWDDIDAYSGEFFEDETDLHDKIDFVIPLPPLDYQNKVTKGLFFSQGLEYILKVFPQIKEIFFCGAYTMWSSYSWCDKADFYLNCYKNQEREDYHKNKYQKKKDIIFIPLQDADFTNEYVMAPSFYPKKENDLICVSTPYEVKNLPILAQAIRKYYEKYNKILKATFVLGKNTIKKDENGKIDYSDLTPREKAQLDEVMNALGDIKDKMNFEPYVDYKKLSKLYSESKCCVLASLIEGKNRSLNEAMSCDTPVIVFKQHNQWARGQHPVFMGNSGEYVPEFTPEALADTIHKVITNYKSYEPRKNYLIHNGRKNFVNTVIDSIPYFGHNIPNYEKGRIQDNIWVDLAMHHNYQLSTHDFIYGKNSAIQHVRGMKSIESLVKFFYSRFGIK